SFRGSGTGVAPEPFDVNFSDAGPSGLRTATSATPMSHMRRDSFLPALTVLLVPGLLAAQRGSPKCDPDNAGLKLPPGFCALVYADTVRAARHMVVAPNGDLIVSAQQRGGAGGAGTGGVWIFRDDNGDGKADRQVHFAGGFTSSEVALF